MSTTYARVQCEFFMFTLYAKNRGRTINKYFLKRLKYAFSVCFFFWRSYNSWKKCTGYTTHEVGLYTCIYGTSQNFFSTLILFYNLFFLKGSGQLPASQFWHYYHTVYKSLYNVSFIAFLTSLLKNSNSLVYGNKTQRNSVNFHLHILVKTITVQMLRNQVELKALYLCDFIHSKISSPII